MSPTTADAAAPRPSQGMVTRALVWAVCIVACLGVFLMYLRPSLVVDLANRLWSCF